jgi:L-iditol 2-dehydrogenase
VKVARSVTVDRVELQEVRDPVAGPGEVVCRVLACGVCGSDVSRAWVARKVPVVLGHELAGEVVEVGAGVDGLSPGDAVVVHHHAPCGRCRTCRRGHGTLCDQFRRTALDPGGFAERVRVPRDLVAELLPLDGLDAERATFTEPLACVLRAFTRAGLSREDELLVVGTGTSGLLAVAAARARGVEVVRVLEPRPDRRALAMRLGATEHAGEPADIVLVCTADRDAIAAGAAACGPGAVLLLYAPPAPGETLNLDAFALYTGEVDVRASYSAGPDDMRAALELLRDGDIDPLPLVTHRLGLAETGDALELQRTAGAIKALVIP